MAINELLERRIPLAVTVALVLQVATIVWWAATKDSDAHFQQQRIDGLVQSVDQTKDNQTQIVERLARIEERVNAELFLLDRLEKQLMEKHWEASKK